MLRLQKVDTDVDVGLLFAVHTFKLLHVMLFISGATFLGEQALLLLIQISSMCPGRASQHFCVAGTAVGWLSELTDLQSLNPDVHACSFNSHHSATVCRQRQE